MSHKFLLIGTGIGNNYGCDAIVLGTPQILKHRFPDAEVWFPHMGWRPPQYENVLGENSGVTVKSGWRDVRLTSFGKMVGRKAKLISPDIVEWRKNLVKQSDCVLSIGGDLYTFANKEKDWPFPYPIVQAGNDIMKLGKPYVIWCASVGPLEKAGPRLGELVEHLKACRAIVVREHDSYNYLRNTLGLTDNVFLAADPAFLMQPEPFEMPFFEKKKDEYKTLAINFTLSAIEHVKGHRPLRVVQDELLVYVKRLLRDLPIKLLLVPHVSNDWNLLERVYLEIAREFPGRTTILPRKLGARKTKWAVSQANALLTMRFHCSLAGFSTNTPTVLLVSTEKGNKITKEMYGDLEHSLSIGDMTEELVVSKVKDLLDNEQAIRDQLKIASEQMRQRALSAADVLANVL